MLSVEEILNRLLKKIIPEILVKRYSQKRKWISLSEKIINNAKRTIKVLRERPQGHAYWCNENIDSYKYDLSIIVPFYNTEKYAKRCIDSVLAQETEFEFEVLLIDDGSSDGCKEILGGYNNCRNVSVYHKDNGGVSDARNYGLKIAKGEYVLFLDSDDCLEKGAIQVLMSTAKKYDADIVEGSFVSCMVHRRKVYLHEFELSKKGKDMYGYPWGKVYKAKLFEKFCFPKEFSFEDTIIPSLIYRTADITITIPDVVCNYYINKGGLTSTLKYSLKCIDTYYIFEEIYDTLKHYNMDITPQFQKALIWQLSKYIYIRCKNIGDTNLKSLFVLCAKLADKYGVLSQSEIIIENYSFWEKEVYQSFVNMQYDRWLLASKMM